MTPLNRCLCCVDCYLPVNDFSVMRGQFPGASQIRNTWACSKIMKPKRDIGGEK